MHPTLAPDDPELRLMPPGLLILALTLRPSLSRADHRRFFGQLRRAAHALDLILVHHHSLCAFLSLTRPVAPRQQHALLNWLSDQVEPACIYLQPPRSFKDYLDTPFEISVTDPSLVLSEADQAKCRVLVRNLITMGWGLWLRTIAASLAPDLIQSAPHKNRPQKSEAVR